MNLADTSATSPEPNRDLSQDRQLARRRQALFALLGFGATTSAQITPQIGQHGWSEYEQGDSRLGQR